MKRSRLYLAVFVFVLAPILTIVLISALLLLHVSPPIVFAPGRALKALIEMGGFHPPNRVAVAGTAFVYWAVIVTIGLMWERRKTSR